MARSTYIYLVNDGWGVVAAFTVKHELITWLRTNPSPEHHVKRMSDGAHTAGYTTLDITELLA